MHCAFEAPANWFGLTESERSIRAKLSQDVCLIDQKELYIRGCLEIPILDSPEIFVWGVWVSVSKDTFLYVHKMWDAEIPDGEPPRFGWLCNWIDGYPEPHEIRCHVFLRSGNLRPRIVLEPTDYPLALEQRNGITLERVRQIAAASHREVDGQDR